MEDQKSLADLTLERERLNEGVTEDRVPTLPAIPNIGLVQRVAAPDARAMKAPRLPRPPCRGIDPDADSRGYYCRSCGYDLIETRSGWYRHGNEYRTVGR